ncbi:hypothetical protein LMG28690_05919 [Paraburkholderia caffeinilytica]|nr:hypothetical protein LMG28690_05919 [Paraburkholderia caffeinilytica]
MTSHASANQPFSGKVAIVTGAASTRRSSGRPIREKLLK